MPLSLPVSFEEQHGFQDPQPIELSTGNVDSKTNALFRHTFLKIATSIVLFTAISFLLHTNLHTFSVWKQWTYQALVEEFPFAAVYDWYVTTFGTPVAFFPENIEQVEESPVLPVSGQIVEPFSTNGTGIYIKTVKSTPVKAIADGIVVFAGNDPATKKTVQIQHADGSYSTYGHLTDINVYLYQSVRANQAIGHFLPYDENDTFYFAIQKNRTYIDPTQVISVDDFPSFY